jgi:bifunctional DNase/RNase
MSIRNKKKITYSHTIHLKFTKASTLIRPSDTVSLSYFIMLPVMTNPHLSQKGKKKEKDQ